MAEKHGSAAGRVYSKPAQATKATGRPLQQAEVGRICPGCRTRLSRYNLDELCHSCKDKQFLERDLGGSAI